MNELIKVILPQQVKVRKYEVDIKNLKLVLKEYKVKSGLTIKQISDKLECPKTLVEHWFRNDNSFSIPDENIWLRLRELLNINTNQFDNSILTFEIRDGIFEKSNRVYDSIGLSPTLTSASAENERFIIRNKINNKGDNDLNNYIKNLTKFNFNMEEIELFDSFAGLGALHQSLNELGVPIKLVGMSEIDVDAIISYSGVHNLKLDKIDSLEDKEMREYLIERNIGYDFAKGKSCIPRLKKDKLVKCYKASVLTNNLGDISKLNYADIPNFDLFNMSFPCTDVSNAGKQKGFTNEDGTTTRSGLYVYGIEVIKAKKPKYIMIENVKGLIQKKFVSYFTDMVEEIESLGYNCYYPKKENGQPTCLNAKNYGVPQNRERIFVICVRKDADNSLFSFPQGFDNGLRLKDLLEDEVDEKYYLSQEIQDRFKMNGSEDVNRNELNVVGSSAPDFRTIGQRDITYGTNGVMSTLTATDYKQPKQIMVKEATIKGYSIAEEGDSIAEEGDSINLEQPNSKTRLGRVGKGVANTLNCGCNQGVLTNDIIKLGDIPKEVLNDNERQRRVYSEDGIAPTTLARTDNAKILDNYRIRKLTPTECWRLMGFRDEHIERAMALGMSNSQLYKQAGNSIVVDVLYYIFKELFKEYIIS